MQSVRYKKKDLEFARLHAAKAARHITSQEIVLRRLRMIGAPLDLDYALLGRLYDRQRKVLYHLKRIEDVLDVKSQPIRPDPPEPGRHDPSLHSVVRFGQRPARFDWQ